MDDVDDDVDLRRRGGRPRRGSGPAGARRRRRGRPRSAGGRGSRASASSNAAAIMSAGSLRTDPASHLARAFGPGRSGAGAVPAAGRGDHVVRAALRGLGVVDGDQGGHPLAVRLLPGRQPGAHLPQLRGGLRGGGPQRPGPHHDALAVGGQDQQRRGRARLRDPGGVERGDVGGGAARRTPRAAACRSPGPQRRAIAACAASNEPRAASSAASFARVVGVPPGRQRQGRVGRAPVGRSRFPPGAPGHRHRAEQRGQQPAVPGLQPGPGDPVGTRRRERDASGPAVLPAAARRS